jgi:Kdo2-lipid IVA lauroyltransferase/acyltransferase
MKRRKYLIRNGVIKLISYFPLSIIQAIGWFFGVLIFYCGKKIRNRVIDSLLKTKLADPTNVKQIALYSLKEFGKTLSESLFVAWHHPKADTAESFMEESNLDLLYDAVQNGKRIVCLTPHIGNFELALKYTAYFIKHKFTILYKPSKNKWMNELMLEGRTEDNITPVPTTKRGIVTLMRALNNREIVGILPDNVASQGDGVWVKFFDQDVFATTLSAKLILQEDVVSFVIISKRLKNGKFSIKCIPYKPTTTTDKDSALYAESVIQVVRDIYTILEDEVRDNVAQYYWGYNRFRVPDHARDSKPRDN